MNIFKRTPNDGKPITFSNKSLMVLHLKKLIYHLKKNLKKVIKLEQISLLVSPVYGNSILYIFNNIHTIKLLWVY